jgi:hypothetical protein
VRPEFEAAEYALGRCEAFLDDRIGRTARLAVGRYTALLFIGVPLAWAINNFHWGTPSKLGLVGGVLLYAIVDIVRHVFHGDKAPR